MSRYFLVLDSKNRQVFKKKLDQRDQDENLLREFKKLDYSCYILEGNSFASALSEQKLSIADDHAFYFKRQLKEDLYFTDKRIKEFLGEPDRIEKLKGTSGKFVHLYSKTRVEAVLKKSEYQEHAQEVQFGRKNRKVILPQPSFEKKPWLAPGKRTGNSLENLAKSRLKELVGKLRKDWDLNEYKEFFPGGLTAFSKLSRGNILEVANQFAVTAEKYKSTLGGVPFAAIFSGYNASIIAALGIQTDKKGIAKTITSDIITNRAPVEDALMAVMFKLGSLYGPNWDKCMSFFDFSLLNAAHHTKGTTSKGVLAGLEKGNCLDVAILVTNTFILKNPNIVPLYYYLSNVKNGVMVGIEIEIKPNTSYVALFNEFEGASGLFLNVKNKTDYTVTWEVHLD